MSLSALVWASFWAWVILSAVTECVVAISPAVTVANTARPKPLRRMVCEISVMGPFDATVGLALMTISPGLGVIIDKRRSKVHQKNGKCDGIG